MAVELKGGSLTIINLGAKADIQNVFDGQMGVFTAYSDFKAYEGDYEVIPTAWESQILATTNKIMRDDVTVREVPYYETSNTANGYTAYIADNIGG